MIYRLGKQSAKLRGKRTAVTPGRFCAAFFGKLRQLACRIGLCQTAAIELELLRQHQLIGSQNDFSELPLQTKLGGALINRLTERGQSFFRDRLPHRYKQNRLCSAALLHTDQADARSVGKLKARLDQARIQIFSGGRNDQIVPSAQNAVVTVFARGKVAC